jgi:hypothetical protein
MVRRLNSMHDTRHGEGEQKRWEKELSKMLLYRTNPGFEEEDSMSGAAVIAELGPNEDNKVEHGILGFQSFVQPCYLKTWDFIGDNEEDAQYAAREGEFREELRKGQIAFYGAFQFPPELIKHHEIRQ